jgi:hypothetical protein
MIIPIWIDKRKARRSGIKIDKGKIAKTVVKEVKIDLLKV